MATELQKTFNPNEHIMQIGKGKDAKDYLPVQWRLVWFRSVFPQGSVETEKVLLDLDKEYSEEVYKWDPDARKTVKVMQTAKGIAVFKAVVKDGQGGVGTGTKSEKAANFPDFIEKAETGAIGRALAALGYGTQFTGDELDETHRVVDSPVDSKNEQGTTNRRSQPQQEQKQTGPLATPAQIQKIRELISEKKPDKHTTLEAFYQANIHKQYPGDDSFPIGQWAYLFKKVDTVAV